MNITPDVINTINSMLGQEFEDDPVSAIKAQRTIIAILSTLPQFEPITLTWFVANAKGYPAGYKTPSLADALNIIRKYGNENTTLSSWVDQYKRHDYTHDELCILLNS